MQALRVKALVSHRSGKALGLTQNDTWFQLEAPCLPANTRNVTSEPRRSQKNPQYKTQINDIRAKRHTEYIVAPCIESVEVLLQPRYGTAVIYQMSTR